MKRKIYREDILKTGLELMTMNGYNATGIKEITDSISIPKGSFYNHFSSKEAFALEVLENYCTNGVENHKRMLSNPDKSPLERLKHMYNTWIGFITDKDEYKRGCFMGNTSAEMADVNEKFREVLNTKFKEIETLIINTVEAAKNNGEISSTINSQATGAFILSSWHGALIRMKASADASPLLNFKESIFNHILK